MYEKRSIAERVSTVCIVRCTDLQYFVFKIIDFLASNHTGTDFYFTPTFSVGNMYIGKYKEKYILVCLKKS